MKTFMHPKARYAIKPEFAKAPKDVRAYIAGLFDGEGCVNFTKAGKAPYIRVSIVTTNLDILNYVQSVCGGRVKSYEKPFRENWKVFRWWGTAWEHAAVFLDAIEPWVQIKREQVLVAQMWIAVRTQKWSSSSDPEYLQTMELLVEQLRWLNRKGPRRDSDIEPIEACLKTLPVPYEQILAEVGLCH